MTLHRATMVIWSLLLFTSPGVAAIEGVLAPVLPASGTAGDERPIPTAEDGRESSDSPAALVGRSVDELDLLAELERLLADRLQPPGLLKLIPVTQLPRVPRHAQLPEVILLDHPARLTSGSALVRFRLQDGEHMLGDHAVSFRAQVLAQVWAPVRRMAPGEPLAATELVTREADLIREPKAVVADPALLGRYEIARVVVPERVLSWADLAPRALVRKGDLIDVVAGGGMLSISMKGQATRSGALGEVVTVRNLDSRREFPAVVIDENRVRVHF